MKPGDKVKIQPEIPYIDKGITHNTEGVFVEKGDYMSVVEVGGEKKKVFNRDIKWKEEK